MEIRLQSRDAVASRAKYIFVSLFIDSDFVLDIFAGIYIIFIFFFSFYRYAHINKVYSKGHRPIVNLVHALPATYYRLQHESKPLRVAKWQSNESSWLSCSSDARLLKHHTVCMWKLQDFYPITSLTHGPNVLTRWCVYVM